MKFHAALFHVNQNSNMAKILRMDNSKHIQVFNKLATGIWIINGVCVDV